MTRLYDPAWQALWLGSDVRWTVEFLHLIGHPISPATWYRALELRDLGASPVEAVALVDPPRFTRTDFDPKDGYPYPK